MEAFISFLNDWKRVNSKHLSISQEQVVDLLVMELKTTLPHFTDCIDKKCPMFIPGGFHKKGIILCKYD